MTGMEILEALGWFGLGFVPAIAAMEIVSRVIASRSKTVKPMEAEIEFAPAEPFRGSKKKSARTVPIGIGVESLYTGSPELIEDIQPGMEMADFEGFAPLPGLP